jgi:hypothetical protein
MHSQDAARKASEFSGVAAPFKNASGNYYDLRDQVGVLAELLRGFSPLLNLNVQGLEPKQEQAFVQSLASRGVVFRSIRRSARLAVERPVPGVVSVLALPSGAFPTFQSLTFGDKIRMMLLLPAVQEIQPR